MHFVDEEVPEDAAESAPEEDEDEDEFEDEGESADADGTNVTRAQICQEFCEHWEKTWGKDGSKWHKTKAA